VRLLVFASVPLLLIVAGTVGYRMIESWSWFNSLYASVITLTSIGYEGKHAISTGGRIFTMVLALGGISTIALAATELLSIVITGELREFWGSRRMRRTIEALDQHVIVCGYGRVGRQVCADLRSGGAPFVVIDRRDASIAAARDMDIPSVLGDATENAVLRRAGIERASALIAITGTDADNVLITLTARLLSPTLAIVARADEDGTVNKLRAAGASRTVCPDSIVAGRMAHAVLHPALLDLIEIATQGEALQIEEHSVRAGSSLDGKTVGSSGLRSDRDHILVAIKHRDGQLAFNPESDALVTAGDTLIVLTPASDSLASTDERPSRRPFAKPRSRRRGSGFDAGRWSR
jgi:voltage-gated potassium channel